MTVPYPVVAIAASVCGALLISAAAFHVYWGLGGRVGSLASVPQSGDGRKLFTPGPAACFAVAAALSVAAVLVGVLAGAVELALPPGVIVAAGALCGAVFLARALSWHTYVGFFKKVRSTRFGRYDTWLFSPICLLLGSGFVLLTFVFWQSLA